MPAKVVRGGSAPFSTHGLPLRSKERRRAAKELLRLFLGRSNRWIAEDLGVDHKTVAAIRSDLEAGGEIPHLKILTGSDGKQYPCTCPKCQPKAKPTLAVAHPQPEPEPGFLLVDNVYGLFSRW